MALLRLELKLATLASGNTQRVLADRGHMPETRLSAIVRRRSDPTEDERDTLCKLLGRSSSELFPEFAQVAECAGMGAVS